MFRSISSLPRRRLKFILAALLLLLFCLPALIAGYGFYQYTRRSLNHDVENALLSQASYAAYQISAWIDKQERELQTIGQLAPVKRWIAAANNGRDPACDSLVGHLAQQRRFFARHYHLLTVLGKDGNSLCPDLFSPVFDRKAFARARQGMSVASVWRLNSGMKPPLLEVFAPVFRDSVEIQAVLLARISPQEMYDLVIKSPTGVGDHVHLVDMDGNVIGFPQSEPGGGVDSAVSVSAITIPSRPWTGIARYVDERHVRVLGVYRDIPGLGWNLLVERDYNRAFAQLFHLKRILWSAMVLVVLLGSAVSMVIADLSVRKLARRERELQTAHEQLITADRLASVGMMAASLAHEINNPLTTIKVLIHSLRGGPDGTPAQRRDLGIVLTEIDKIKSLVLRFLQFARPREPEFKSVRVDEILSRISSLVRPQAQTQGLLLFEDYDPSAEKVWADPSQIGQVFLNILLNAVDATPVGGEIRISTAAGADRSVVITIWNSGPGLADNLHERVFEPFFSTKATGTGLGLSIARTIMDKHRGTVRAEGHGENGGTSFIMTLQATDEESAHASRTDR